MESDGICVPMWYNDFAKRSVCAESRFTNPIKCQGCAVTRLRQWGRRMLASELQGSRILHSGSGVHEKNLGDIPISGD